MSQLTASTNLSFEVPAEYNEYPVADNVVIYSGSAIGSLAGYARQLVAADVFLGFSETKVDNTLTGHAAGLKTVQCRKKGCVQLSISGAAVTDLMKDVYASDGNAYTFTVSGNSFVGKVVRYVSSGVVIVSFDISN